MLKKVRRILRESAVSIYNACCNRPYGVILTLHRIGPKDPDRLECMEELKVSVDYLQRFVDSHRATHDFVSIAEAEQRMRHPELRKRPFICFTIDDGYRDNLTYGLPFFEKNKIPFTVFVTAGLIDRRPAFNWPFLLERILRDNEQVVLDGVEYSTLSRVQKNAAFVAIKQKVQQKPYIGFEQSVLTMLASYMRGEYYEDLTMTWDEVRLLAASPLCTIGAHTMTHCRLSNVPTEWLDYELRESKQLIEQQIGCAVEYLSYPFGWTTDVNDQVTTATRDAGYRMGLVAYGGPVRRQDKDMYMVKRQALIENE